MKAMAANGLLTDSCQNRELCNSALIMAPSKMKSLLCCNTVERYILLTLKG